VVTAARNDYFSLWHLKGSACRIVADEDRLRLWKPDDGGEKWFCGDCGSSLFGRNPSHADSIGIRMVTFDDNPGIRPSVRQFVAYAASWEPIPDDGRPATPRAANAAGSKAFRRRLNLIIPEPWSPPR
jgi:hypothetical protein